MCPPNITDNFIPGSCSVLLAGSNFFLCRGTFYAGSREVGSSLSLPQPCEHWSTLCASLPLGTEQGQLPPQPVEAGSTSLYPSIAGFFFCFQSYLVTRQLRQEKQRMGESEKVPMPWLSWACAGEVSSGNLLYNWVFPSFFMLMLMKQIFHIDQQVQ